MKKYVSLMKGKIQYSFDDGFLIVYHPENTVTNLTRTLPIHPDDCEKATSIQMIKGIFSDCEVEFEIEGKYARITDNNELVN